MNTGPIIFSGPMVQATLREIEQPGTGKTLTRRVVKPQPPESTEAFFRTPDTAPDGGRFIALSGPVGKGTTLRNYGRKYAPGDLLWVKENWAQRKDLDHLNGTKLYEAGVREAWYWADGPAKCCNTGCAGAAGRVRTALFMPRWASRLTLRVTGVRVERVQEISEQDAEAEGLVCDPRPQHPTLGGPTRHPITDRDEDYTAVDQFAELWDSINTKRGYPWADNPWVWVIKFEPIMANVGEVLEAA